MHNAQSTWTSITSVHTEGFYVKEKHYASKLLYKRTQLTNVKEVAFLYLRCYSPTNHWMKISVTLYVHVCHVLYMNNNKSLAILETLHVYVQQLFAYSQVWKVPIVRFFKKPAAAKSLSTMYFINSAD